MTIYLGADHRGFALKEAIKKILKDDGYDVADLGAEQYDKDDDYPTFAGAVARKVSEDPALRRGIVICGSGFGVDIAANKFAGVRSALAMSSDHIYVGRHDDDVNVLALAADFLDQATAIKIVKVFVSTPFAKEEPRYKRRLDQVTRFEAERP